MMSDYVEQGSIVREIWADPDLVLLIFAGAAAEFALNRAVDWLFFTGRVPGDPIGRLFSTVRYAQEIVFADEEKAHRTLERINAIHGSIERQREQAIPDWAYRDVLYMLVDYSERAYGLLYRPLSEAQQKELYTVFRRVGEALRVQELPTTYAAWQQDRRRHLRRDLVYSDHTALLFEQYRRHLGSWRYRVLLLVQALLVPDEVRCLLRINPPRLLAPLVPLYGVVRRLRLQPLVRRVLVQPKYRREVRMLDRSTTA